MSVDAGNSAAGANQGTNPIDPTPWYDGLNPRTDTIELIITLVMIKVGMQPLDQGMKAIAQQQKLLDEIHGDIITLNTDISTIQNDIDQGHFNGNLTDLEKSLQSTLKDLFGGSAFRSGSNGSFTPEAGSLYDKLKGMVAGDSSLGTALSSLKSLGSYLQSGVSGQEGTGNGDYTNVPAGQLPGGIGYLIQNGAPDPNDPTGFANFTTMINVFTGNYYLKTNPKDGTTPGNDYLSSMSSTFQGDDGIFQGIGNENSATLQTDAAQENSLDQTGQNILQSAGQLKTQMLQTMTA